MINKLLARVLLLVMVAGLFCVPVLATHALEADFNYGWTNHGYTEEGHGWVLGLGISSYFTNTSSFSTTSVVHGSMCEPLVLDTGGDGKNDIVSTSGNYINLYSTDFSGNLQLIDQYLVTNPGCGSIAMINGNTIPAYIFSGNQGTSAYIYVFTVNATKIHLLNSSNVTKNIGGNINRVQTNVQCSSIHDPNECFFSSGASTTYGISSPRLVKFIPDTNNMSVIYGYPAVAGYAPVHTDKQLVVTDWDNDGHIEAAVMVSTYTASLNWYRSYIFVVDTTTKTEDARGTATDEWLSQGSTFGKLAFYNLDGGTHIELLWDYGQRCSYTCSGYNILRVMDTSGTENSVYLNQNDYYVYGWAAGRFTANRYQVCELNRKGGNVSLYCCDDNLSCFVSEKNKILAYGTGWSDVNSISSADYNLDGYEEIVFPNSKGQIYSPKTGRVINTSNTGAAVVLVDMNDDGIGEIVGTNVGMTKVIYTNYSAPPVFNCTWCTPFTYLDSILNHDWKGQSITPTQKSSNYFLNYTTSLTNYIWREFSCSGSQINFSFSLRLDDYDKPDDNSDPFSEYQFELSLGHGTSNNINIIFADYNITGAPNKGLVVVLNGSTLVNSSAITYDEGVWYNYSVAVDLLFDTYDFFQNGVKIWDNIEMAAPLSVINNISFGWLNYVSPATAYLDNVCANITGMAEWYYNYIPYVSSTDINSSYLTQFQTLQTTMYFSDAEANTMYAAVDCDWQTGREAYTCLNTPYAQCTGAVSSPQNFNCEYNTTGTKTIKYYVNDNVHNGSGAQLSQWNYATRAIVVYENGSLPPGEAWAFNYLLVLQDYDSSNKIAGAVAEMFDVPTQGVNDYEVKTTGSDGFAYFNFSNLNVKFCLNATISSYLWYKDCAVDVSLDGGFPRVSNRYLKKLESGSYETYWEYRVRENCQLNGKPEWYGWYHGNSELSPSWTSDSGYSYKYESALGYALALNNTGAKGFFHRTYTVNPESRFEFSVRMKPTVTSFADSNELYVNLWGVGHKQIAALRAYTQDSGGQEKVFLQYWHPTLGTWKAVWNNSVAQVPFSIKILTDVNGSRYSVEVRDFGLFEEKVSGIPFIVASTQPAFFELKPIYTSNPNKDIFVDAVWFLDKVAEEDLLPEGIEQDDVCNQYYYDTGLGRWKYDKNRCDACKPGESIFFCMFKNSFRWAIAKFAIWVLKHFLYFLLVLVLIILLAPIIVRWRQRR